eukprot:4714794-Prymnesium_polylepis.2
MGHLTHVTTAPAQVPVQRLPSQITTQQPSTVPQSPLHTPRVVNARTVEIETHQSANARWHTSMTHDNGQATTHETVQQVTVDP